MRNIRILVEFASVVMPGGVLLLAITELYASHEWFASSVGGVAAAVALAFALGHLLQGVTQALVEPAWRALQQGGPAAWAVRRFSGCENRRFLTVEQLEQLETQFPAKLAVPFPPAAQASDAHVIDSITAHVEAFIESSKLGEATEDYITDLKLNKGLFTAFLLIASITIPVAHGRVWLVIPGALLAAAVTFARMDRLNRKYIQTLLLVFLTTPLGAGREGGQKGNAGGGAGGGGALPFPLGRGGGGRLGDPDDGQ